MTDNEEISFVDEAGRNLELHRLVYFGEDKSVEKLLKNGTDVNKGKIRLDELNSISNLEDVTKSTPIHIAAFRGNLKCAKLLVKYGADVNRVRF